LGGLALPLSQAALCLAAVPLGLAVTAISLTLLAAAVKRLAVGRTPPGVHRSARTPLSQTLTSVYVLYGSPENAGAIKFQKGMYRLGFCGRLASLSHLRIVPLLCSVGGSHARKSATFNGMPESQTARCDFDFRDGSLDTSASRLANVLCNLLGSCSPGDNQLCVQNCDTPHSIQLPASNFQI